MSAPDRFDYFAGQAMLAVMQETQETVVATPIDMVKALLRNHGFGLFDFLHVEYRVVDGIYADAAERACLFADAMMQASARHKKSAPE